MSTPGGALAELLQRINATHLQPHEWSRVIEQVRHRAPPPVPPDGDPDAPPPVPPGHAPDDEAERQAGLEDEKTTSTNARETDLDPNSWLLDERLDRARAALSKTYNELTELGAWHQETENLWKNLQQTTEARRTMAQMTGLMEARIRAAKEADEINKALVLKYSEMELRLRHLEKIGGVVLNEKLKEQVDADAPPLPPPPVPQSDAEPVPTCFVGSHPEVPPYCRHVKCVRNNCARKRQYQYGCVWENCCKSCYATDGQSHDAGCDRRATLLISR